MTAVSLVLLQFSFVFVTTVLVRVVDPHLSICVWWLGKSAELRYLYSLIDEHDNAVRVMIDHSPVAWEHTTFKEQITQVRNLELYYRVCCFRSDCSRGGGACSAVWGCFFFDVGFPFSSQSVSFYLDERPDMLVDLLASLASRIDHARVVNEVRRSGHLPLIKRYMESVQPEDNKVVNENLNNLYVEEGEWEKLRASVDRYGSFDQIGLAQRCEKMSLLEFRRIAAHIYKVLCSSLLYFVVSVLAPACAFVGGCVFSPWWFLGGNPEILSAWDVFSFEQKNERYHQSIELSKNDKLYQDAMETAADSGNEEVCGSFPGWVVPVVEVVVVVISFYFIFCVCVCARFAHGYGHS